MPHHFNYDRVREMRSRYIPYSEVERLVSPQLTDVIVDVGSGEGFYAIKFAGKASEGQVYAAEISDEANRLLAARIEKEGLKNVRIVDSDICRHFDFHGYNKVFFSTSFHDLNCREELLDTIRKNAGDRLEIILIEFRKDATIGPPADIKISSDELCCIFERHGFRLTDSVLLEQHYIHKYSEAQGGN